MSLHPPLPLSFHHAIAPLPPPFWSFLERDGKCWDALSWQSSRAVNRLLWSDSATQRSPDLSGRKLSGPSLTFYAHQKGINNPKTNVIWTTRTCHFFSSSLASAIVRNFEPSISKGHITPCTVHLGAIVFPSKPQAHTICPDWYNYTYISSPSQKEQRVWSEGNLLKLADWDVIWLVQIRNLW